MSSSTSSGRHAQGRVHPHHPTASARSGTSAARTSPAGRSTTSRARRSIRTGSTPRKPAAGSGRSFSAPTTAAKPGTNPARRAGEPTTTPDGMPKGESNKFVYDTSPPTGKPLTTHQWYDGTQHPWEFKRVWHLEPSLTDPDTVYAGVEDAALFRSTDGGKTWHELAGLRGHGTGPQWTPGAGGMGLHTILLDPNESQSHLHRHLRRRRVPHRRRRQDLEADQPRAAVAIHSRSRRRGRPLRASHRDAPVAPERAVHAEALGRACAPTTPATSGTRSAATCRPTSASRSTSTPTSRKRSTSCRSRATRCTIRPKASSASTAAAPAATNGSRSPKACRRRTATSTCCATRCASTRSTRAASTSAPPAARSTASPDGGDSWTPIVRDLPAVLSVEVQTMP